MLKNKTGYHDIDEMLSPFVTDLENIFGIELVGVYLTGSLSYNAFRYESSDIDVTVIIRKPVKEAEVEMIRELHQKLRKQFPKWSRRLECSYTPEEMLASVSPPGSRPWYWGEEDILYSNAPYGNEWIINQYFLVQCAIPLFGPEFKELSPTIDFKEVQKACILDFFTEWEPKQSDIAWFQDSHFESYFILNLCRILYVIECEEATSKQSASSWAIKSFPEPWPAIIKKASHWEHGMQMGLRDDALQFLRFATEQILSSPLGVEMREEISRIRNNKPPSV